MAGDVTRAAALILPDEPLDAVVYSCTSASVVIGDDRVRAAVRAGKPGRNRSRRSRPGSRRCGRLAPTGSRC
ncbi:hypothetical protein ACFSYD_18385 [Paracoccus aerius]